jgi:hypothetical protein
MNYLKVKGHDGLVRDASNGAIINTNTAEYNRYLKQKQLAEEKRNQLDQVSKHSEEINNIKNELNEIKSMILQLLTNK